MIGLRTFFGSGAVLAALIVTAAPGAFAEDLNDYPTAARALERLSLVFLVGGIIFELVTGLLFEEYWVPYHFDFTAAHYYGAWVFFGALVLHTVVKLPKLRRSLRTRGALSQVLRTDLEHTVPEPPETRGQGLHP